MKLTYTIVDTQNQINETHEIDVKSVEGYLPTNREFIVPLKCSSGETYALLNLARYYNVYMGGEYDITYYDVNNTRYNANFVDNHKAQLIGFALTYLNQIKQNIDGIDSPNIIDIRRYVNYSEVKGIDAYQPLTESAKVILDFTHNCPHEDDLFSMFNSNTPIEIQTRARINSNVDFEKFNFHKLPISKMNLMAIDARPSSLLLKTIKSIEYNDNVLTFDNPISFAELHDSYETELNNIGLEIVKDISSNYIRLSYLGATEDRQYFIEYMKIIIVWNILAAKYQNRYVVKNQQNDVDYSNKTDDEIFDSFKSAIENNDIVNEYVISLPARYIRQNLWELCATWICEEIKRLGGIMNQRDGYLKFDKLNIKTINDVEYKCYRKYWNYGRLDDDYIAGADISQILSDPLNYNPKLINHYEDRVYYEYGLDYIYVNGKLLSILDSEFYRRPIFHREGVAINQLYRTETNHMFSPFYNYEKQDLPDKTLWRTTNREFLKSLPNKLNLNDVSLKQSIVNAIKSAQDNLKNSILSILGNNNWVASEDSNSSQVLQVQNYGYSIVPLETSYSKVLIDNPIDHEQEVKKLQSIDNFRFGSVVTAEIIDVNSNDVIETYYYTNIIKKSKLARHDIVVPQDKIDRHMKYDSGYRLSQTLVWKKFIDVRTFEYDILDELVPTNINSQQKSFDNLVKDFDIDYVTLYNLKNNLKTKDGEFIKLDSDFREIEKLPHKIRFKVNHVPIVTATIEYKYHGSEALKLAGNASTGSNGAWDRMPIIVLPTTEFQVDVIITSSGKFNYILEYDVKRVTPIWSGSPASNYVYQSAFGNEGGNDDWKYITGDYRFDYEGLFRDFVADRIEYTLEHKFEFIHTVNTSYFINKKLIDYSRNDNLVLYADNNRYKMVYSAWGI